MINIPEDVLEYIKVAIEQGDYEFADNFRAAKVNEDQTEYEATKDRGCCGFYDTTVFIHGEEWNIGFNYGH